MKPQKHRQGLPRSAVRGIGVGLGAAAFAMLLGGCSKPLVQQEQNATIPQRLAQIACVEECRVTKEKCDEDARYDYRQCQAGYSKAFRNYRWCLASAATHDECGYPGWSCAENLYGYCSNRYHECETACRGG